MRAMLLIALFFYSGFYSALVVAAPAPWYLWQSRVDSSFLCTQATPGEGWVWISGPYKRAQCNRVIKQLLIGQR